MKASTSEYVVVRGRRIHVRRWGDGTLPQLFLLHGWNDVSASFQFVVDALRRDWCVIAPDWRGFGLSQWNDGPYWFPDYVADLDALLEHYSPQEAVRLVGHSMGGNVAMLYGGIRPQRVAGILNLEGFGLRAVDSAEVPERYARWLEQLRTGTGFRTYADREAFALRLRHDNPRLTPLRAAFLAEHLAEATAGGVRLAADPCHRLVNPILYRIDEIRVLWRRVSAPTLWVRGADSAYMRENIPSEDDYRERLACLVNGRAVLLADSGHNLHHDRPEAVAQLLEEFFA